jgi:uncharacterized protein YbjQ (UPF0145 family)
MHHLGRRAGCTRREIASLEQDRAQAAQLGVEGATGSGSSSADDTDVIRVWRSLDTRDTICAMILHEMVTTTFTLDGWRVTRNIGLVRGIIVRSRSLFGTIGAGLQTLVGGNISLLTDLCEKTRNEAFERMMKHADELGANAVIGVRYDATEVMQGVTEVLCYGTAVVLERERM